MYKQKNYSQLLNEIESNSKIKSLIIKTEVSANDLSLHVDNENIYELNKTTINLANIYLSEVNSAVVIKTFQNNNFKSLKKEMELFFEIVQTYKPAASKNKSAETYLYGAR